MTQLDDRLTRLKSELDDHARIATHLGLDFDRPIRSLGDGYPENTVALVGKMTERILKQLWRHHDVPGDPAGKALNELIKGCKPHISSRAVLEALYDIQQLRNRSTHDGYNIAEEDGLTAVRRLLEVLAWFADTGSTALTGDVPVLAPEVAERAEFLAGLYLTLGYRPTKRFELSRHTVYQLFSRETGLRVDYVELLLSRDLGEVRHVLASTGGELLRTGLPKLTRFLVLDHEGEPELAGFEDYRVVTYDRFMDTIVNTRLHLDDVLRDLPAPLGEDVELTADLLTADDRSGEMTVVRDGDAAGLLAGIAADGGNALVVGGPGSGKTTLLKQLVAAGPQAPGRRYRFYFDITLKERTERFSDFVARVLAPYMAVETSRIFDVLHYFARSGKVVCALDGIDEAVSESNLNGFLALFTELAQLLSAESSVIMSSRLSFLEDSPQVRRLLDGTSLMSEKLVHQLHAEGVDPLSIPRFSALRLHTAVTPLARTLARTLDADPATDLADLVWQHLRTVLDQQQIDDGMAQLVAYFGPAALAGRTTFSLLDLYNALGLAWFTGGRLGVEDFALRPLMRPVGTDRLTFAHAAYPALLAAEYLRDPAAREQAARADPPPLLTDQIRAFLHHRSREADITKDCVLRPGTYLVGPSHHLMLRQVTRPVRFDRHAVTVRRYNTFLDAVRRHGSAQWDHPDMPPDYRHEPWQDRLRIPDYYTDPAYADHPAVCVNWWSACAFARFEGKRLPTSLEWEAAARGTDGRIFPWGDDVDIDAVNCADAYAAIPLVTYEAWKVEHDRGALRAALPGPVDARPRNVSPIGVAQMVGNVWEMTSTVLPDSGEVVICGGSFDNPYRAVQVSSKGLNRRRGASNAVGFRCVEEL